MPVLNAKRTKKNLLKKGFVIADNHSSDHIYLNLIIDNRIILHTKISHGAKDLDNYLIHQMSRQCKITKDQFVEYANCDISKDQYLKLISEYIDQN